jgi:predicted anti-sigma-YlaC factor YlaD
MLNHLPMMINCREFEAFLLDYLEDTLPARQRFIFDLHLRVCRECRDYLMAYKRAVEVSQQVFPDGDAPIPHQVPEDLIRAILDARNS